MGTTLSLRHIESHVSGSYNVGSLRLNADNKLEHVNSHVFAANGDHVTKEQNKAVRDAIDKSFKVAYGERAKGNQDLRRALDKVNSMLLRDSIVSGKELSRDEVRAILKGLYRINKGGKKNIDEGWKWIETAKVISELKDGNIIVDKNYMLVSKDGLPNAALEDYKNAYNDGKDVKLNSDFLRGCKWGGTTKRWNRAINFGTGEKKSVEIVSTGTPEKIGTWLKDRLRLTTAGNQQVKVIFDTKGWGPRSREMAEVMTLVVQKEIDDWCEENPNASRQEQLEAVRNLIDEFSQALFVENDFAKYFKTEHSLSDFSESKAKEHLKGVLLDNYNDNVSGNFPGLHKDFIRVCQGDNASGWLNIEAEPPKKVSYTFEPDNKGFATVKKEKATGEYPVSINSRRLIEKLCAIKNEKVRKMVSFVFTVQFPAALYGSAITDEKGKTKIIGGEPFAAYRWVSGSTAIVPAFSGGADEKYGWANVKIKSGGKVEMTIKRLVAPIVQFGEDLPPEMITKPLKKPVCVEYKVTIKPGRGNGDPQVEVTSAKILPDVSKLEPGKKENG